MSPKSDHTTLVQAYQPIGTGLPVPSLRAQRFAKDGKNCLPSAYLCVLCGWGSQSCLVRFRSKTVKLGLALTALIFSLGVSTSGRSHPAEDLPEGKGVEVARDKCIVCHEADLIVSQRLSRAGWVREVEKMIRWGASVSDAEKEMLVDYFAAHFGQLRVNQPVATSNEGRGKEIFETKCLLCHEADLTQQQRLSRPGWTREVEKMVRWGATITDAEKEPLVDYLFKNFGPRPLASGN